MPRAPRVQTYQEGYSLKEYLASAEDVLKEQSTSADAGLSTSEAQTRQAKFGPNKLKEEEKTPLWIRFFQQMADPWSSCSSSRPSSPP